VRSLDVQVAMAVGDHMPDANEHGFDEAVPNEDGTYTLIWYGDGHRRTEEWPHRYSEDVGSVFVHLQKIMEETMDELVVGKCYDGTWASYFMRDGTISFGNTPAESLCRLLLEWA